MAAATSLENLKMIKIPYAFFGGGIFTGNPLADCKLANWHAADYSSFRRISHRESCAKFSLEAFWLQSILFVQVDYEGWQKRSKL